MATAGSVMVYLGANTMGLHQGAVGMQRFETKILGSVARMNAAVKTLGATITKVGSLPVALAGGYSIKMFADFETSLTKIIGLVGVSQDQVQQWGQQILQMGPQLGKGPQELADALYFITSAGIRGAEAMDVLTLSAKASAAGLGETKEVADLVTSAMNAYGKENLNAAQATDVIVATVREGKAEADKLASTMGIVLPIASKLGVRFNEVGAATAAMTRTGTKATTSAVQLRQILNSLLKVTPRAAAQFGKMGFEVNNLRKRLSEGDALLPVLRDLDDATARYGEETMAKLFPNIRALNGVIDILGANLQYNVKVFDSVEDAAGSLDRAFAASAKTTNFSIDQIKAAFQSLMITIGADLKDVVLPLLIDLIEKIKDLSTWWRNLTDEQKDLIEKIALLTLVGGPLLTLFSNLLSTMMGLVGIFATFATGIAGVTSAVLAMGVAVYYTVKNWDEFKDVISNLKMEHLQREIINTGKMYMKETREWNNALKEMAPDTKENTSYDAYLDYYEQYVELSGKMASLPDNAEEDRLAIYNKMVPVMERMNTLRKALIDIDKEMEGGMGTTRALELRSLAANLATHQQFLNEMRVTKTELTKYEDAPRKFLAAVLEDMKNDLKAAFPELVEEFNKWRKKIDDLWKMPLPKIGEGTPTPDITEGKGLTLDEQILRDTQEALRLAEKLTPVPDTMVDDAIFNMYAGMAKNMMIAEKLGETYDGVTANINLLKKGITELLDEGYAKLTPEQWEQLGVLQAWLDKLETVKASTADWGKVLEGVFQGMQNAITQALSSTEGFLRGFAKFFGDFIKGLIFKLIAATIAALVLVVVLSMIPGLGGANAFKGVKAGIEAGKGFQAALFSMLGATNLADGGIIPSGFPNDSFRANLSTNEAVIPLEKLPSMLEGVGMGGQVVFHIDGKQLVGVLEEQGKLYNAF